MNLQGLINVLSNDGGIITRSTTLTTDRAVLTIHDSKGRVHQVTVRFEEYIREVKGVSEPAPDKIATHKVHSTPQAPRKAKWSIEELRARDLPLYWSKAWLVEALNKHGSYQEIARVYGYKGRTIAKYAMENYGMRFKRTLSKRLKEAIVKDWLKTGDPLGVIAERHGVGKTSVFRCVQGLVR